MDENISASVPEEAPSLATRTAAAVALAVGFHLLAVVIGAGLIAIPVLIFLSTGGGNLWLALACFVTGGTVLGAVMPRRQRFEAPGVRVGDVRLPRLEREIARAAAATGERLPDETYLTLEVNAAVTQVRGRRVLIIGLPLLQLLSVSELRAVLAHEFGHYAGGDTRLGPWVWRTRTAIGRTLQALNAEDGAAPITRAIVRLPFHGYATLFMRITAAISRREEYAADAMAIRCAGGTAHTAALRKLHATDGALDVYLDTEFLPVLFEGRRPDLVGGFARFLDADRVRSIGADVLAEAVEEQGDTYDSHPTLGQRLAFAERFGESAAPAEVVDEAAVTLLDDVAAVEHELLRTILSQPALVEEASAIAWDAVAAEIILPGMRARLAAHGGALAGATLGDPPVDELRRNRIAAALQRADADMPGDLARHLASTLVTDAVCVTLVDHGWTLCADPGEHVTLERDGRSFVPDETLAALADGGEALRRQWAQPLVDLGLADLPLSGGPQADTSQERSPAVHTMR